MRSDELYLRDMVTAAHDVAVLVAGQTRESLEASMPIRRALLQALTEIGEAAARVSSDLRARWPSVAWREAVDMRNVAVHAYFGIDWGKVLGTACDNIPALCAQIEEIVQAEYPPGGKG